MFTDAVMSFVKILSVAAWFSTAADVQIEDLTSWPRASVVLPGGWQISFDALKSHQHRPVNLLLCQFLCWSMLVFTFLSNCLWLDDLWLSVHQDQFFYKKQHYSLWVRPLVAFNHQTWPWCRVGVTNKQTVLDHQSWVQAWDKVANSLKAISQRYGCWAPTDDPVWRMKDNDLLSLWIRQVHRRGVILLSYLSSLFCWHSNVV